VRNAQQRVLGDEVQRLLDKAVEEYFQLPSAVAWKKLVTRDDVVGLKVNALAGAGLSTHRELVDAICERLEQAGVAGENIIIWDRLNRDLERAGFAIRLDGKGPRCYGNDVAGYTDTIYEYGYAASRLSRIVSDRCTVLINVPVLKDHGIVGVSVGMKNFFGAIDNPNKYHDNVGDPYVADVNMLAPIRTKLRLVLCDALTAQYEGGPPFMEQWSWPLNSLLLSTDRVAIDLIGWELVESKRKEVGRPSLKQAGREPRYIHTAGDAAHRLGVSDRTRIRLLALNE
jgi:uncharacterized protein (DUF362 family)